MEKKKSIKSRYHLAMTDGHFEACLRLATGTYCPDYATLNDSILYKISELGSDNKCIQLYCVIRVHAVIQGTWTYVEHVKYTQYIYKYI